MTFVKMLLVCMALVLAETALTSCQPNDPRSTAARKHVHSGNDWIDLKQYDKASSQFRDAIRVKPKSPGAWFGLARTDYLEGDYLGALDKIRKLDAISSGYDGTDELLRAIRDEGVHYMQETDAGAQAKGLSITAAALSDTAGPALKALMGGTNNANALKAAKLLQKLDRDAARTRWIDLLHAPQTRVRYRAAEQLWNSSHYKPAVPVLRNKYRQVYLSKRSDAVTHAGERLVALGYEEAQPVLVGVLRSADSGPRASSYALKVLVNHHDRDIAPMLISTLHDKLAGSHTANTCAAHPYRNYINALNALGVKSAAPLVKVALSNALSSGHTACAQDYLDALAHLDNPAWTNFVYLDGRGNVAFSTLFKQFQCATYENIGCSMFTGGQRKGPAVDNESKLHCKLWHLQLFLGKCGFGGCSKGYKLVPGYITIRSPDSVDFVAAAERKRAKKRVGQVTIVLRPVKNGASRWVMSDLKGVHLPNADINAVLDAKPTADQMFEAAERGQLAYAECVQPNSIVLTATKRMSGATPLFIAARSDRTLFVRALLSRGVSVANKAGASALYVASRRGNAPLVKILLDAGASPNLSGPDGRTPLIAAAAALHEHSAVVKLLISSGAKVNVHSGTGRTPLIWAAKRGKVELVTTLLNAGADVSARTSGGQSALQMATMGRHARIVKILIEHGANPRATGNRYTSSALEIAKQDRMTQIVRIMLKHD